MRKTLGICAVAVALIVTSGLYAESKKAKAKPLKGLIITGGCCHDYKNQKNIIAEGLSKRINIEFDVVHEGGSARNYKIKLYEKKDWAKGYDIIVHNECFGGVKDDEFVEKIVQAHRDGTPAVVVHCSMHSYRSAKKAAESWRAMLGVTSRSHEKHRAVEVKNVAPKNPIMTGFPAKWNTPNGELYKIEKIWPKCTPLATAYGKDTKKDHVVIWTNEYEKARIFGTTLGHHNQTMDTDEWMSVVSRGVLWATKKLKDDGTPADGYQATPKAPRKKTAEK